MSEVFKLAAESHFIELKFSGVESHNSIGGEERCEGPLWRIFRFARRKYPAMDPEVALRFLIKALNYTMEPEGTIPSMIVFGTFPTLSDGRSERKDQ